MRKWVLGAVLGLMVAGMGCQQEGGIRERQEKALKDPWNYSPYDKTDPGDVSGGGLMDFKQDAFKRDVNSAFSP